jgi:cholesterol transport system auxiliary component
MTGDKAAYLAGARWVAPARILFQEALQRRLELGAGPARLASIADGSARGFLSVAVTRFEADYAGDGPPTARVALVARLVERDGEVLGEVRVSEEAKASANAVSAIVAALDLATREAVAKVGAFADEAVLRAHAPGARPAALNR